MSERKDKSHSSERAFPKGASKIVAIRSGDRLHRMDKDRIVIGSVVSADIRLLGEGVSPIHAVIEIAADPSQEALTAKIYDLASETGVFIGGKKVVSQELPSGTEITIGRHKLGFAFEDRSKAREESKRDRVLRSEGRDLYVNPAEDLIPLNLQDEREIHEIFDYRPTHKQALEVVMSFGETILDVRHFAREREVTIGPRRKDDFGIPPWLPSQKFPLVTRQGDLFILNLDPKMTGVLQRDGQLLTLDEVRQQAPVGGSGAAVALGKNEFAKIILGDVQFYLSYTAAPPRLKRRRILDRDPLFFRMYFTSLMLSALTLVAMFNTKVPPPIEAEQLPDRVATILYKPQPMPQPVVREREPVEKEPQPVVQKPRPEPTKKPEPRKVNLDEHKTAPPKTVPKTMAPKAAETPKNTSPTAKPGSKNQHAKSQGQSQAKEGEGARARGKEGTRGEPNKQPSKNPQTGAKRPSPMAGPGRGAGRSQVPDNGNVDFLKGYGGKIENILGNSAAQLGKGGEKLKGFGGFSTQGQGGLALSGDGRGGGGTADSLGGLGKKGRGGGRVGTGLGAVGSGSGIIGGQARVALRTGGPEETVVMGSIDVDAIDAALLAHRDEFRLCYEKEINAETPDISGRVTVVFTIGATGRAFKAGVDSSTIKNANVDACVVRVIKRIQFPLPNGGGDVTVTKSFKYAAAGK